MAATITLPGAGAIDLDVQDARILNVGLLRVEGDVTQDQADRSAAPRSYIDEGDVRAYDAGTTYLLNEYVLHNNRIWFANQDSVINVEPGSSAADWVELSRSDVFLTINGDAGPDVTPDAHDDTIHILGGANIDTVGGDGVGGAREYTDYRLVS